jgi:hypothetical protein
MNIKRSDSTASTRFDDFHTAFEEVDDSLDDVDAIALLVGVAFVVGFGTGDIEGSVGTNVVIVVVVIDVVVVGGGGVVVVGVVIVVGVVVVVVVVVVAAAAGGVVVAVVVVGGVVVVAAVVVVGGGGVLVVVVVVVVVVASLVDVVAVELVKGVGGNGVGACVSGGGVPNVDVALDTSHWRLDENYLCTR